MGGKLVITNGSCKKCNRTLGSAESAIKKATTPLLNLLRIKNRDNEVPRARVLVNIHGLDMQNLPGYMDRNGEMRLRDYVRKTVTKDGQKVSQGFFISRSAAGKFAVNNRAKGRLIKRNVPNHIVMVGGYTQDVMFAFSIEARKVAAKIALAALAYKYGAEYALSKQFDELRQVRDAKDKANIPVYLFANHVIQECWIRTPHQHSVICYLSAGMKKGWMAVTLFGGLCYLIEVSNTFEERSSKQFSIFFEANTRTCSNPVIGANEMTLIGEVLSPDTVFETPLAVDAQWFKLIAAFFAGTTTIVERLADRPPKQRHCATAPRA